MKQPTIHYSTFDNLKFPTPIYKYREAENPTHLTILTEKTLFLARPDSFEDKLDCKIPVRHDLLTDDEIYNKYYNYLKLANPEWDSMFLRDEAIRWCNLDLLKDKDRLDKIEEHFWKEFNAKFGVLSLTAICDNLAMWKKYSSNFNGFCVGLNPKIAFQNMGGGGPVNYVKTLPIINIFDTAEEVGLIQSLTKLKKWDFEKEYRVQKFWNHFVTDTERKFIIAPNAYLEIILGNKMKPHIKKQIIDIAVQLNPKIKIRIAEQKSKEVILTPFAK